MNYAELRKAIIDWSEDDGDEFGAHIDDFIRAAELRVFREADLRIFREHATTTIARGEIYLTLPDDTNIIIRELFLKDIAGKFFFVRPKDQSFLREYWPDQRRQGKPRFYSRWAPTVLMIAPTPDSSYYVEIEYTALPESIVTAGTTWLGTNGWDALLAAAMIEAYAFMKEEQQAIAPTGGTTPGLWQSKYLEALKRLQLQELRERVDDFRSSTPG